MLMTIFQLVQICKHIYIYKKLIEKHNRLAAYSNFKGLCDFSEI